MNKTENMECKMKIENEAERHRAIARHFILGHNQENYLASIEELLSPNCVVHEYLPGTATSMDRQTYIKFIDQFHKAISDIHNKIEDIISGEDKVVIRWVGNGIHNGAELMGIRANDGKVFVHGISILQFVDDKIIEVWNNWDNLNMIQQLGGIMFLSPDKS